MHSRSFPRIFLGLALLLATFGPFGCGSEGAGRNVVPQDAIDVAPDPPVASVRPRAEDNRPTILFLGTSLTAGYGLEDPDLAFPALVQSRLDSLKLEFRVVNAGVAGDTSAGGLDRLRFLLASPLTVLVLELGANDGLRGLDPDALAENLNEIIVRTRAAYPQVRILLAGMEAPTNLGQRYTDRFREVFIEVARERDTALIPFLLEGVAAVPELNQADRIHPTPEGHRIIAETVWASLAPILEALQEEAA